MHAVFLSINIYKSACQARQDATKHQRLTLIEPLLAISTHILLHTDA
jgi:hypothetical protein